MLDDDNGPGLGDVAQKHCRLFSFSVRHSRQRLVNKKKLRLLHQKHSDFEPLLLAMRKTASEPREVRRQVDPLKYGNDPVAVFTAKSTAQ